MGKMNALTCLSLCMATIMGLTACSEPGTSLPYPVEVTGDQAGPLRNDTPFDAATVSALMPGFDVQAYTAFVSGAGQSILVINRGGRAIFTVSPTPDGKKIGSVTVHAADVRLPRGVVIGAASPVTFDTGACSRLDSEVRCRLPGLPNLSCLFASDPGEHPEAVVEAVIWMPHV